MANEKMPFLLKTISDLLPGGVDNTRYPVAVTYNPDPEKWEIREIPLLIALSKKHEDTLRLARRADHASYCDKKFTYNGQDYLLRKQHLPSKHREWDDISLRAEDEYMRLSFMSPHAPDGQYAWWMHCIIPGMNNIGQKNYNYVNYVVPKDNLPFPIEEWDQFLAALDAMLRTCFTEEKLKEILSHERSNPFGGKPFPN